MNYVGGGFLPITCEKGEPILILGREHYGKSKGLYADFGGGIDRKKDSNIIDTVLRETREEFYLLIKNIYTLPYVDVPTYSGKYYRLVIGRLDNYSFDYFYLMREHYKQQAKGKYSHLTEMDHLVHIPIKNIIESLANNKKYVKDLEGNKIRLRSRLWLAFKHTAALGIINHVCDK